MSRDREWVWNWGGIGFIGVMLVVDFLIIRWIFW